MCVIFMGRVLSPNPNPNPNLNPNQVSATIAQDIVKQGAIGSLIKAAHMHTTNAIVQVGPRPQTLALTLDHRAGWARVRIRMNVHQQRHRAGGGGGRTA